MSFCPGDPPSPLFFGEMDLDLRSFSSDRSERSRERDRDRDLSFDLDRDRESLASRFIETLRERESRFGERERDLDLDRSLSRDLLLKVKEVSQHRIATKQNDEAALTWTEIGNGNASSSRPTLTWSVLHARGPGTWIATLNATWSGSSSGALNANETGCWTTENGGCGPLHGHHHRRRCCDDPPPDECDVRSTRCRPTSQLPSSCRTERQTQRHCEGEKGS